MDSGSVGRRMGKQALGGVSEGNEEAVHRECGVRLFHNETVRGGDVQ